MRAAISVTLAGVVLATAAPVVAAPAPANLAGTTVLRTARSVMVDVRVPRATALRSPLNGSPDLVVSGSGFAAVALVGRDSRTAGTVAVGGSFGDATGPSRFLVRVDPVWGGSSYEFGKNFADEVALRPGAYRLYVATNGPVTVTLKLRGLSGSVVLPARSHLAASLSEPPARLAGAGSVTKNVYTAGSSVRSGGRMLLFHGLWYGTTAHAAGQVLLCHGPAAPQTGSGVEPACPAAGRPGDISNDRLPTTAPDAKMHLHAVGPVPAGPYDLGFSYVTESVVTGLKYVTLAIPL